MALNVFGHQLELLELVTAVRRPDFRIHQVAIHLRPDALEFEAVELRHRLEVEPADGLHRPIEIVEGARPGAIAAHSADHREPTTAQREDREPLAEGNGGLSGLARTVRRLTTQDGELVGTVLRHQTGGGQVVRIDRHVWFPRRRSLYRTRVAWARRDRGAADTRAANPSPALSSSRGTTLEQPSS